MAVTIKPISNTSKKDLKRFILFNYKLYRHNKYAVPEMYDDLMSVFMPSRNAAYEFCDAQFFLAYRDSKVVGRVAAIINHRYNEQWERKAVRFGWLDLVDDADVMKALLTAVEDYGRRNGMTEIIGPLGFTDMDPEGMLIEGFDQLGTMATIYNHDYYPRLMEQMTGYEKDNDYVEYKAFVPKGDMPEKFSKVAQMVEKRYNLHCPKLKRSQVFGPEQYGQKVLDVVNKTFGDLYGYSQMTQRQIDQYVHEFISLDGNIALEEEYEG